MLLKSVCVLHNQSLGLKVVVLAVALMTRSCGAMTVLRLASDAVRTDGSENTRLLCKERSITVWMVSGLTTLQENMLLFVCSKASESKPVKL